MSDAPPVPPAPLVTDPLALTELRDDVATAVVAAVGADLGRDALTIQRAVLASLERVATALDREAAYASRAAVPAIVYDACVSLACVYMKRPGAGYGTSNYDDADPLGVRAEGTILAALQPGNRQRWGVA